MKQKSPSLIQRSMGCTLVEIGTNRRTISKKVSTPTSITRSLRRNASFKRWRFCRLRRSGGSEEAAAALRADATYMFGRLRDQLQLLERHIDEQADRHIAGDAVASGNILSSPEKKRTSVRLRSLFDPPLSPFLSLSNLA